MVKNWGFLWIFAFSLVAWAQEDEAEVTQAPPAAQSPRPLPNTPSFKEAINTILQAKDSFANRVTDPALYFRVPESEMDARDEARKESLHAAERALFEFFRQNYGDEFKIIQDGLNKHQEFIVRVLLTMDLNRRDNLLDAYYSKNPDFKLLLAQLGLFSWQRIHANVSKEAREIRQAQAIEQGYHHLRREWEKNDPNWYKRLEKAGFLDSNLVITSDVAAKFYPASAGALRAQGLNELWNQRDYLLSTESVKKINTELSKTLKVYAPYGRIYIDAFKEGAFFKGSREFVAIWRSNDQRPYRHELLAMSMIKSGQDQGYNWQAGTTEDSPRNTPDGRFRLFGFDIYHKSKHNDDMRGLIMLSYGNGRVFVGRGFHLLQSHSWGVPASHGCFRVATEGTTGFAHPMWAIVNPMQLNQKDYLDFGDGDIFQETQLEREIIKTMRDRVHISTFSRFVGGYNYFEGDYSKEIRDQYKAFDEKPQERDQYGNGLVLQTLKRINDKEQSFESPDGLEKRKGNYWVFDQNIQEKMFQVDLGIYGSSSKKTCKR